MYAELRSNAIRFVELFRSKRLDRELDEEMRFHLAMLREANIRRGMDPEEARLAAQRRFGSTELAKDEYRDGRGFTLLFGLMSDLKIALRTLAHSPRFTLGIGSVLTLTVAATVLVISAFNAIVLRPLPYPDASSIFEINKAVPGRIGGHSWLTFQALRTRTHSFSIIAGYEPMVADYYFDQAHDVVRALPISAGYFELLKIPLFLGRSFAAEDESAQSGEAVILSYNLWQARCGGDRSLIGKGVTLNGTRYTVVGVTPADFRPFPQADIWVPLRQPSSAHVNTLDVLARIKPGLSVQQAQEDAQQAIATVREDAGNPANRRHVVRVLLMQDILRDEFGPICALLLASIVLVHIVACLNTMNLVLARLFARARDAAVRMALGAKRGRIMQHYLTESMLLTAASGIAGLLLAKAVLPLLSAFTGDANWNIISIDGDVLRVTLGVVLASGLTAGLFPALLISRIDPNRATKEGRWRAVWSHGLTRKLLVAAEIGFAVLLLISSGLLLRSLASIESLELGFDPHQVLTAKLGMATADQNSDRARAECVRALKRLSTSADVQAAAIVSGLPFDRCISMPYTLPDRPELPLAELGWRYITPEYFEVMRIPLLRGRAFDDGDSASSRPVALVNREFARVNFGSADPIGRRIRLGLPPDRGGIYAAFDPALTDVVREIVGVTADARERGVRRRTPPMAYIPMAQTGGGIFRFANAMFGMGWVVRMQGSPDMLVDSFRRDIAAAAPDLRLGAIGPMQSILSNSISDYRTLTLAVSAFAAFALIIAISGIYGLISYTVTLRQKELAIGIALGAPVPRLLLPVVSQGIALGVAGVIIGISAAFAAKALLSSFVYVISATDPATLLGIAIAFPIVAAVASLVPALRVMRIDPAVVLRCD